jgi:hypothetical protein
VRYGCAQRQRDDPRRCILRFTNDARRCSRGGQCDQRNGRALRGSCRRFERLLRRSWCGSVCCSRRRTGRSARGRWNVDDRPRRRRGLRTGRCGRCCRAYRSCGDCLYGRRRPTVRRADVRIPLPSDYAADEREGTDERGNTVVLHRYISKNAPLSPRRSVPTRRPRSLPAPNRSSNERYAAHAADAQRRRTAL